MPSQVIVRIAGAEYLLDLQALHRACDEWKMRPDVGAAPMQALAAAAGVSRCTVWRFVSGQRVGLLAARQIAGALGLAIGDVLTPANRMTAGNSDAAALKRLRELEGWMAEIVALVDRIRRLDQE